MEKLLNREYRSLVVTVKDVECFENHIDFTVEPCRLVCNEKHDLLACSPDGLIDEQMIVEVNCPESTKLLRL